MTLPTIRLVFDSIALSLPLLLWLWLHPVRREAAAALLASGWALPAAVLGGLVSTRFGAVTFPAPVVLGTPPDLLLGRVLLGGFVAALCFPSVSILRLYGFALALDLADTSLTGGVFTIRDLPVHMLVVAFYLIPAQLFARWTRENRRLVTRAALHVVFHAGLLLGVLPALIVICARGNWNAPFARASFVNKFYLQLLMVPAVVLISSVQEFVRRGRGTPAPADPPRLLVTSGTYAYVANPMQLGKFLVVAGWGLFWSNSWVVGAALLGLLYSVCIATPREESEMTERFPHAWRHYRHHVRRWSPRWKPYYFVDASEEGTQPARLHLLLECQPCRELAEWIRRRATGLLVLPILVQPIEDHPMPALITYDPGDGCSQEHGVVALARALEHINLAWALIGWMLRLPGIAWLAQCVADSLDPQNEATCELRVMSGVSQ
jgi:protein-S-isoprenylcysteine O-methyltransferase Ste14